MSNSPRNEPTPAGDPAPRRYWAQRVDADGAWRKQRANGVSPQPPGEDLAALRSGLGRPAGTVPALWRFYTSPVDGQVTTELEAEHAALSLYGLHQQSQSRPMHSPGSHIGTALRTLHLRDRFSEEAVDRRVASAVHASSVTAFVYRLRGLVTQLRSVEAPLDYDRLLQDIKRWHYTESRQSVRRDWGLAYHVGNARGEKESSEKESSAKAR
ncbi:type I-E CRISPR-associated protein Cse2/CasB [Streptomyces sp. NPDC059477]|uniref:type I-E CRISPR-associated protein Cse2/CasB n=1 Tax=Streptomyces sp. NPDC059477 TaxID=3346847 RepID=UPI0036A36FAB